MRNTLKMAAVAASNKMSTLSANENPKNVETRKTRDW
jgi:hypothetical protein